MLTNSGKITRNIFIQRSTKMEAPNKQSAPSTSLTLKECLNDPDYLRALDIIVQAQKNAIKNGLYPFYEDE